MTKSKPKRFKKKVKVDYSITPRDYFMKFFGIFLLLFVFGTLFFFRQPSIIGAKILIITAYILLLFLALAHIPKRKVYWEEVKND